MPFYSEALDWCCGDGNEFLFIDEGLLLMPTLKEIDKGVCKGNLNRIYLLSNFDEVIPIFNQNVKKLKRRKERKIKQD